MVIENFKGEIAPLGEIWGDPFNWKFFYVIILSKFQLIKYTSAINISYISQALVQLHLQQFRWRFVLKLSSSVVHTVIYPGLMSLLCLFYFTTLQFTWITNILCGYIIEPWMLLRWSFVQDSTEYESKFWICQERSLWLIKRQAR